MNNIFFTIEGYKYLIMYNNKNFEIYKEIQNEIIKLSEEENNKIRKILNQKYNYIYDSQILNELVNSNDKIENKDYIINILNWLEQIIPENDRSNFYNNIKNLQTQLNLDFLTSEKNIDLSQEYSKVGGYNTTENKLIISEEALNNELKIANMTNNPEEFFWRSYTQPLLHELCHMASSKYDSETKISLCGFDIFPPSGEGDKNRGLTEGFTELISMAGVPGTIEIASGYYIEACLINQLIQVIGKDVFLNAYFSNLGTKPIEEKLQGLIDDEDKSFELFRNIELNFQIRDFAEKQNVLGNIQMSILDYLEQKIDLLLSINNTKEINECLTIYEQMLITPEKLNTMNKNPKNYCGLEESLIQFDTIKQKCSNILIDKSDTIQSKK
ncbi:MAG: hypothetical protein ACI4OT_00535 [Bacilli bacterium]